MTENNGDGENPPKPEILPRKDGTSTAYHRFLGQKTTSPGVVFCHGLHSDMTGTKATVLESFCRDRGLAFVRFDLFGHGESAGEMEEATLSRWVEDAVTVVDELTTGPQIFVGSSLGGWIALCTALARPERIAALIGIAAAPDFTEDMLWTDFSPEQREQMMTTGRVALENRIDPQRPWMVRKTFIEDGRNHLLLRSPIGLTCPVTLLHGQGDETVPWRTSLRIAENLASEQVEVVLVKDGDHRLSRAQDLDRLTRALDAVLARLMT